jgi:tetrapyrrole methylase family protein/MazG family protein
VAYAVPGSPSVAEQTVSLLRSHDRATDGSMVVEVVPALSFLDLAWARLGVDPLDAGVRLIDATVFASEGAGGRGPLLVAQCWSKGVLSDVKLTIEPQAGTTATVLHHLGLPDELVSVVAWDDLDRVVEPDHLTSLWIPRLPGSPSVEIVRLRDRVRVLRGRIAANE